MIVKNTEDKVIKWEFESKVTVDKEIEEAIPSILYSSTGQPTAIKIARALYKQYLSLGGEPICEECSLKLKKK